MSEKQDPTIHVVSKRNIKYKGTDKLKVNGWQKRGTVQMVSIRGLELL